MAVDAEECVIEIICKAHPIELIHKGDRICVSACEDDDDGGVKPPVGTNLAEFLESVLADAPLGGVYRVSVEAPVDLDDVIAVVKSSPVRRVEIVGG